jgi:cytidine deaminase
LHDTYLHGGDHHNFKTKPRSITIKDSKTAWGTCDSKQQLTFNWRLAMAPQEVPCGMCRELISDYGKNIDVIIPYNDKLVKCNVLELLPEKYTSDI